MSQKSNKSTPHSKSERSQPKISSIVHKPFATGTVNFFTPHKKKTNNELNSETLLFDPELKSIRSDFSSRTHWIDRLHLFSCWKISAIVIFGLVNITSGAIILARQKSLVQANAISTASTPVAQNSDLGATEFIPLDLSTLSKIQITNLAQKKSVEESSIEPELAPELAIPPAISSLNPQYYYVLTEYSGDRSLALAKEKVKQVSLVNFPQGIFIYLGAFTTKEKAQKFIAQIKKENLSAYIYPFE